MKNLFILVFIFSFFTHLSAQPLAVGVKAPEFSLKNIDGKTVSLSDYSGEKGVVLIFTCNTCPVVAAYEDRIIGLHKEFATKGYPVVTINPNDPEISEGDSFSEMKKRAVKSSYPFPYLFDEKQEVFKAYGATRTPEVFVLTKTGDRFVVSYTGTIDDNSRDAGAVKKKYAAEAINSLLAGNTPSPATTKAVGCGIKYK